MAYEFIHRNMAEALPSLRTVQSLVHSQYSKIEEGVFRFDALVQHLRKYNSPFIVAVAEDATRIVQKVEYDPAMDRCVGFVLPVDDKGLPVVNTFTATTFQEIEEMFKNRPISKYAYLYTATPLKEDVPSFALACVGTDNKFTTELVMLRWKYIQSHLAERGICVISFAADGDSRLLSAMRSTYSFSTNKSGSAKLSTSLKPLHAASYSALKKWLCVPLYSLLCVQDIVHLGVKLKARLLKPSIILPLGSFVASGAHLHILVGLHGKETHGLRRRDIDHRDKQNFDAVEHIISASYLLESMPDAIGTKCYIDLMKASIYSYLNKSLSPEKRLEEMWYAVFFVRYWRQWICLQPQFTLSDNFILGNAYMCIEINAHSLLAFILMMHDMPNSTHFCPW